MELDPPTRYRPAFDQDLACRLDDLARRHLRRELRWLDTAQATHVQVAGRGCLNFSSNDYLGLASDMILKSAAIKAIEQYGTGSGASRLISGSLPIHRLLEEDLASFKHTADALVFSTGYATAVGTITALLDRNDVIILDRLAHACIIDGSKLSGTKLLVFPHNDMAALDRILKRIDQRARGEPARRRRRVLIATESVFSMDGDQAPLPDLVAIKDRYGASLLLDEAHATGVFGPGRSGLAEAHGLSARIEVQMGTLGKALGVAGGFIAGSRVLIDYLVNKARSFIFSTAPAPADIAAARAAIQFVRSPAGEGRCRELWSRVSQCDREIRRPDTYSCASLPAETAAAFSSATSLDAQQRGPSSPIIPILIGDESRAIEISTRLLARGLLVPAVRHPTVPKGKARLRVSLSALHKPGEVSQLARCLEEEMRR